MKRRCRKHRTPNAAWRISEWIRRDSVREDAPRYGPSGKTDPTIQRSTLNAQRSIASKARFDLEERLLGFSARIIRLADALPNTRAANHIAGQLLRCGTSPYGNHGEVEAAESRKDFLHKLKSMSQGTEGDSSLVTTSRKIIRCCQRRNLTAILNETEN